MFENQGFDAEDYAYMKGVVEKAIEQARAFCQREANNPPEGI